MEDKRLTVLESIQRGKWVFRASVLQDEENYSIMLVIYNIRSPNSLYFRFFNRDEDASAFVDECAAGKYGDKLDDMDEKKT